MAVLAFFALIAPGNHSEAEDAFEYSRLIEGGRDAVLFHPHHLLYLPLQKAVFQTVGVLGYGGRSYYVARAVSMVGASLALFLFYLIACRLQGWAGGPSDRRLPLISTLGLLCSYGFVRYACEVEIYIPAMALALAAVYSALRAAASNRWFAAGIVFAALAVLMHTINAAVALVVLPSIYLLVFRQWKRAALHAVATLAIVGLVYLAVQNIWGTFHPPVDSASEGGLQPGTIGKAMVGFGQCILSANFVFAYETVAEKLQALFPYRVFTEELFAAAHMPPWLKAIAPVTFVFALAGLIGAAGFLFFNGLRRRVFSWTFFVLLLWLGGTMFPTLLLEPSNPELWILALAPLWAVFLWLAATLHGSGKAMRLFALMVCLLGAHNLVAGMGSMRDREGDYNFKKAEWVLRQATPNDVLNTSDSFVFTFYLNYWSQAETRNINTQGWKSGATTYVFGDVFSPPAAIGVRYPEFAEKVAATATELKLLCRKIHDDQFGGIWIVDPQESQ